jgi:hypothetical protein
MKENKKFTVFISWSEEPAGEIAKQVQYLLEKIFPNPDIFFFVSNLKICGGDDFRNILNEELENSHFGILILTKNNIAKPWIMFESGALSKHSNKTKIMPILFDRSKKDIEEPIKVFNYIDYAENKGNKCDFSKYKEKIFFDNLILPIERKRYNGIEPNEHQKCNLKSLLRTYWNDFENKINETLSKPIHIDVEKVSKDVSPLMMREDAYEKVYAKRDDQLIELVNSLPANKSKNIIIFGGLPTTIRNSYREFASWLIRNAESNLFLCYENENIAEVRTEDLKIKKDKMEEVKKMQNDITLQLGEDGLKRVHFIEMGKSTSLYIVVDGDIMYFTPTLDKRSSDTFTFKLKKSDFFDDLLTYMESRIENKEKENNMIFINKLKTIRVKIK